MKTNRLIPPLFFTFVFFFVLLASCTSDRYSGSSNDVVHHPLLPEITKRSGENDENSIQTQSQEFSSETPMDLIYPADFQYKGAFRLPVEPQDDSWGYSGYALTYFPDGDNNGDEDHYPGSLFILGHDQINMVAEINIPIPQITEKDNLDKLPYAQLLQPFLDPTQGMFSDLEIPRIGLAYLPPQGNQTTGKLYFCFGQHFQFEQAPSHGWSELNLSSPDPAGPWTISQYTNYTTNDYLFEIPEEWSEIYTPGLRLATGRFRDGSWSGLGPALFAIGPWEEGNPPSPGTTLQQVVPLLLYGENVPGVPEISVETDNQMQSYSEPDEWSGGEWLITGNSIDGYKSSVIFVGTKAEGSSWYGFSNGVEYPISGDPDDVYPEVPPWPHDDRGWWSDKVSAQILFYDPLDLGAVTRNEMETWDPQPYATMILDDYLYDPGYDYERGKRYLLGGVAYDRENGLLYIVERMADAGERSLIHVFQLEP